MANDDIRWIQRFNNFSKTLAQLEKFINKTTTLNDMETQGLIQCFEYNFELAWNLIKDYYEYQGEIDIQGSRDSFRLAFRRSLIEDGEQWMNMIESRKKTPHTYNDVIAGEIALLIRNEYFTMFKKLHSTMFAIINSSN
ncbi:MAG: nucleotidyltransferase substrate binding protein [Saprospiraceae bacterium]